MEEGSSMVARLLIPALPWWVQFERVSRKYPIGAIAFYNDHFWRRQKTIVKLFDRAIERLQRQCLTE